MESPTPLNPLGVKGAAESGTIAAPAAIASAVEDALSPFGVRIRDLPITPERLVALIRAAGKLAADTRWPLCRDPEPGPGANGGPGAGANLQPPDCPSLHPFV